jgi:preprotein translocase subunit SecY
VLEQIITKIQAIFANQALKKKLIFTLVIFAITRLLAHIPVPVVDVERLKLIFVSNEFLSFLNLFAGGTLARFSIVAVGINPYITASIVMQLLGMVIPKIKEMQKEGESGQAKLNQYMRIISVPVAAIQAIATLALLNSQDLLITQQNSFMVIVILTLIAGSMLMMWLGELISEYGMGNGISMILLVGILSQIPASIGQSFVIGDDGQLTVILVVLALTLAVIALVVFFNEAVRKVNIQYAKRIQGGRQVGGQSSHLPIKVNVAGVMPIIFAVSLMMLPPFLGRVLTLTGREFWVNLGEQLNVIFSPTSIWYVLIYFVLVFVFSYFSAIIFFNAEDISDELKKSGAFIPGIRPGGPTRKYLEYVVTRVTFAGAIFLASIAVLPTIAQMITGIQALAIGGTSLLIVVSVILETAKQVESQLLSENYDRYSKLS